MSKKAEVKPIFNTQAIYAKSASIETKDSNAIFQPKQEYKIAFKLEVKFNEVNETTHEVVLGLTVTASPKDKEDTDIVYEVQVEQAGRFVMEHFEQEQIEHIRNTVCPNMLFPFAREAVVNLVTKAGFPAVYIAPINFDAVNAQRKVQAEKEEAKTGETVTH